MYGNPQERQLSAQGVLGAGSRLGEAMRAETATNLAKPAPEITAQVERLQHDLGELGRAISELGGRLSPVRRIPPPADSSPAPDPIGVTQTPIGNQLGEIRREVLRQLAEVHTALHELELP